MARSLPGPPPSENRRNRLGQETPGTVLSTPRAMKWHCHEPLEPCVAPQAFPGPPPPHVAGLAQSQPRWTPEETGRHCDCNTRGSGQTEQPQHAGLQDLLSSPGGVVPTALRPLTANQSKAPCGGPQAPSPPPASKGGPAPAAREPPALLPLPGALRASRGAKPEFTGSRSESQNPSRGRRTDTWSLPRAALGFLVFSITHAFTLYRLEREFSVADEPGTRRWGSVLVPESVCAVPQRGRTPTWSGPPSDSPQRPRHHPGCLVRGHLGKRTSWLLLRAWSEQVRAQLRGRSRKALRHHDLSPQSLGVDRELN